MSLTRQYSVRDAGPGVGLLTGTICLSGVLYLFSGWQYRVYTLYSSLLDERESIRGYWGTGN